MIWKNKKNQILLQAILAIKTQDEAMSFLYDLMTKKEITEFSNRLLVAEMLLQKIPYSIIENKTGLSSTTIARVAKYLKGKKGGYKTILSKLHHNNSIQLRRELL